MLKIDRIAYATNEEYASFPGIIRSDRGVFLLFGVQKIKVLKEHPLHAHYSPVSRLGCAMSRDGGRSWETVKLPVDLGHALHATRGGYYARTALSDGSVVSYGSKYLTSTQQKEPLRVHIYQGQIGGDPVWRLNAEDLGPHRDSYPFSMIHLPSGRLLAANYAYFEDASGKTPMGSAILLMEGSPDGKQWSYLSSIEYPLPFVMGEPGLFDAGDGRIVCLIRPDWHNVPKEERPEHADGNGFSRDGYGYFMFQSESRDEGRTWSEPQATPIWGHPHFALPLRSGRILVVYGHRRPPFEVRAVLSDDGGRTWPVQRIRTIHRWEPGGYDLGYPVATQLDDGSILCAYYGYSTNDTGEKAPHAIFTSVFDEQWLVG